MSEPDEGRLEGFSEADIHQMNDKILKNTLITPDVIYLDLALMRDYQIGTLMTFAFEKGEAFARKAYASVIEKLPEYRERYFFDAASYFPVFGISTDEMFARLKDKTYANHIFRASPMTEFASVLGANLAINANHSAVKGKREAVHITVNTYPVDVSDDFKKVIGTYFAHTFGVEARVICKDIAKMEFSDIKKFQEYYLYHFREFSYHQDVHKALGNMEFTSRNIYAAPICGFSYDKTVKPELLAQQLLQVKTTFDIACHDFKHIPIGRCSPPIKGINPLRNIPEEEEPT